MERAWCSRSGDQPADTADLDRSDPVRECAGSGAPVRAAYCLAMAQGTLGRRLLAGAGLTLLVIESPLVFSSGLVMPIGAVIALAAIWAVAVALALMWFTRRPLFVLALPFAVAAAWFVMVTTGEHLLGWQA